MIHYALVCADGHEFDGWFKDSAAFDSQTAWDLVHCPICRSARVEKAMMAPHIARAAVREDAPERVEAPPLEEGPAQLRAMLRELREKIESATEDVGEKFPDEARKMQDREAEKRAIRGKASLEEAKALIEEGIEILPMPGAPGEGH